MKDLIDYLNSEMERISYVPASRLSPYQHDAVPLADCSHGSVGRFNKFRTGIFGKFRFQRVRLRPLVQRHSDMVLASAMAASHFIKRALKIFYKCLFVHND